MWSSETATLGKPGNSFTPAPQISRTISRVFANMTSFASPQDIATLEIWNSKTADYPADKCLQDLFWEQAEKTPNAVALVDGTKTMTYAELNDVTDRMASVLFHQFNVRPDSIVAIFMERSAEYVIAYLSALKAGGAYMPVELVYPQGMVDRALKQTDCSVVLTKTKHQSRLPPNVPMFQLDLASSVPSMGSKHVVAVPKGGFEPRPEPDNLAFVVMSSGTTGTPKGICQVHRSAVHSYTDRFKRYPYHVDSTTNQVADRVGAGVFFVWECVRPLMRGATCVVIPDDVLFDPEACTLYLQEQNITRVLFTPSLLQLIMDTLTPAQITQRLGHMRMVWLCGEVVTVDLATKFGALTPTTDLLNLYSISECHDATIGNLKTELDATQKYATCGKNIPNVTLYIVDFEDEERTIMRRVPIALPGEVYVGGPVLARGYLKMPQKSAERFVDNPFGAGKLYRTGDMGRMLKDGTLEIVGRCDFMVKVRGYSVVLGAVETALAKHPRLASAVVLALGAEGTDKRLVAWVVPKEWKSPPSAAHVRNFLKDHLPPYAIPGTFCVIDALPVNQSAAGKLDRKHKIFQNPDESARLEAFNDDDNDAFRRIAPTNDIETMVLTMFSDLLLTPDSELSTGDNFFDIGGHSLLATRLLSKINEHWFATNPTFKLKDVMGVPTVIGIGLNIQEHLNGNGSSRNNESKEETLNLDAEAHLLDASIYPAATRKGASLSRYRRNKALMVPNTIFLTGATGYLGVHILAELISNTTCDVVCVVRAKTNEAAMKRITNTLSKYNLSIGSNGNANDDNGRVVALAGDLSKPLLGMDSKLFKEVATGIDSIIHCGAEVNLIKPYSALKAPNVLGTQEILRLATTNSLFSTKVKPLHYISTNGVFPVNKEAYGDQQDAEVILCREEHRSVQKMANEGSLIEGYAQSKYVAETMCDIARSERGLPVSIMRPGNMSGNSTTGMQNVNDFVYLFFNGCLLLEMSPSLDCDYYFDLTPVDFAARVVVNASVKNPTSVIGQTIHLQNPQRPVRLNYIIETLIEIGHVVNKNVTKKIFLQALHDKCQEERKKGIQTSVLLQLESGFDAFETYFVASKWLNYDSTVMQSTFSNDYSIACPSVSKEMLQKWFPLKKE